MSEKLDMTVNRLPAITWNWLKMNQTKLSQPRPIGEASYAAELPDGFVCEDVPQSELSFWGGIATGMGKDMDSLGSSINGKLISASQGADVGESQTAVVRISEGENKFGRLCLRAKKHSNLNVAVVCEGSSANGGTLAIQIKVYAEEGAKVRLYCAQLLDSHTECLYDIGGVCEDKASVELIKLELGGSNVYAGVLMDLKGADSAFDAGIGYIGSGKRRLDMNYVVRHRGERTVSNMDVSGVLKDEAFKLFRGSIDFLSGCAGSKGEEREEVLLLSDSVVNQTIPLILCAEENVEGNHGATIGELDEKTLFYLASRGISQKEAEKMVARARIERLSGRIPVPQLQQQISDCVDALN